MWTLLSRLNRRRSRRSRHRHLLVDSSYLHKGLHLNRLSRLNRLSKYQCKFNRPNRLNRLWRLSNNQ